MDKKNFEAMLRTIEKTAEEAKKRVEEIVRSEPKGENKLERENEKYDFIIKSNFAYQFYEHMKHMHNISVRFVGVDMICVKVTGNDLEDAKENLKKILEFIKRLDNKLSDLNITFEDRVVNIK